jgi:hypothetical protein
MRRPHLPLLPIVIVLFGVAPLAHADMYRWVDAKGLVNVSNLPPPDGVRVTSVTKETPQDIQARYDALFQQARQAEMQAMADRIQQLEQQVQAPPPQPVIVAPTVQVVPVPVVMQAPVQYDYSYAAPQPYNGCDPSWAGCSLWNPWYYPTNIVVVNNGPIHRRPAPPRLNPGYPVMRPLQGLPALNPMQAMAPSRRG